MAAYKTNKGRFIPRYPEKYMGNPAAIFFRSSWELILFKYLDSTPAVLQWASEEFSVPYLHPIDNKVRQYYPDALVIYKDKYGNLKKEIVEIKPHSESVLSPKASEAQKLAYVVNQAKWRYAAEFAAKQGMTFRVITEKTLFAGRKAKK